MAENRKGETWVVRTPPGMKQRLTARAKRDQLKGGRNELAVRSFERELAIEMLDDELPHDTPCDHSDDKLREFAYGTFCVCGVRVQ